MVSDGKSVGMVEMPWRTSRTEFSKFHFVWESSSPGDTMGIKRKSGSTRTSAKIANKSATKARKSTASVTAAPPAPAASKKSSKPPAKKAKATAPIVVQDEPIVIGEDAEDLDFFTSQPGMMARFATASFGVTEKKVVTDARLKKRAAFGEASSSAALSVNAVMAPAPASDDDISGCEDVSMDDEEHSVVRPHLAEPRARVVEDDITGRFENQRRVAKWQELPQRLPIKDADGALTSSRIARADIIQRREAAVVKPFLPNTPTVAVMPKTAPTPVVLTPLQAHQRSQALRIRIGVIAQAVCESPEENIGQLKELQEMCTDTDTVVAELSMLSQVAIFIDIAPGYPIRAKTDAELAQKMTKEMKVLWKHESTLLASYRHLLDHLLATSKKALRNQQDMKSAQWRLGHTAVRGLCELLKSLSHFNFVREIMSALVPMINHSFSTQISDLALAAVTDVIRRPQCSDHALECVNLISGIVEGTRTRARPALLRTLLSLPLRSVSAPAAHKPAEKAKSTRSNKGKKNKQTVIEKALQKDIEAAKAVQSQARTHRVQLQLLQCVFKIYFTTLKYEPDSHVLPVVLEGLAKFSHLINVELVLDLLACLRKLIDGDVLTLQSTLHCSIAAFQMLVAQGNAIVIDAQQFYQRLYVEVLEFADPAELPHLPLLFECLELMFIKRRQISVERVAAFVKRLASLAVHVPPAECMGVLRAIQMLVGKYAPCARLFENDVITGGKYQPEAEEPEHANPFAAALWEIALLQESPHPAVAKYARILCGQKSTSIDQLRHSPTETMQAYQRDLFNPAVAVAPPSSARKRSTAIRSHTRGAFDDAANRIGAPRAADETVILPAGSCAALLRRHRIQQAQAVFHADRCTK